MSASALRQPPAAPGPKWARPHPVLPCPPLGGRPSPEVGRVARAGGQPAPSFRPSLPGSRPPAPGPQPRLKAPHCVRSSPAGGARSSGSRSSGLARSGAGARGRGGAAPCRVRLRGRSARVCVWPLPHDCAPHTYIPFLRRLSFSRTLLPRFQVPSALGLQVPPTILGSADPRACLSEPSPWCHWVPLTSLGSLRSTSAPADSPSEDTAGCGLELGGGHVEEPLLSLGRVVSASPPRQLGQGRQLWGTFVGPLSAQDAPSQGHGACGRGVGSGEKG